MRVGQLSKSNAVDAIRLPFYSSGHPTGSHGWGNLFDLGNLVWGIRVKCGSVRYDSCGEVPWTVPGVMAR